MSNLWTLNAPPKPAQVPAMEKAHGMDGWGHFLDMGLGKTSLSLNEHLVHQRDFGVRGCVVVAPQSFKPGWAAEAEKFGYPNEVFVYESGDHKFLQRFLTRCPNGLVVVNYESYKTEGVHSLMGPWLEGGMLVVDESIKMKDHRSATTKSLIQHRNRPKLKRILSGKPITQGPHDLWPQLKFIGGIDDNFEFFPFRNYFCMMGGFTGWQVIGAKNEDKLKAILDTCSFTARKEDYLDIIPKSWPEPFHIRMSRRQDEAYKSMLEELWLEIADGQSLSVEQVITRNLKLQQITAGFIIDEEKKITRLVDLEHNPKIAFVRQFISEQLKGKIVISAIYKESINMLGEALKRYEPVFIRGDMSSAEIEKAKATFNTDDYNKVIVVQQRAAKYGHTLLGTSKNPCYSMLFFENSYSLDDRSQIEDRIHRIGQNYGALYYDLVSSGMDKAAIRALVRKEDVAAAIMGYAREKGLFGVKSSPVAPAQG